MRINVKGKGATTKGVQWNTEMNNMKGAEHGRKARHEPKRRHWGKAAVREAKGGIKEGNGRDRGRGRVIRFGRGGRGRRG